MKRSSTFVLLIALFAGMAIPVWGQSSTEGKEFWVGLTMAIRPPGDGDGEASPYLAISTKDKTTVTFASPAFPGETFTQTIDAFKWEKVEIPKKWWYPSGVGKPTQVKAHADEVNNYGVYISADKNISVFSVLRAGAGMDASNILPVTAIGTEYILQDYIPHAKEGGTDKDAPYTTMATILATEDNTVVKVKPSGTLLKANTPKLVNNQITLNKGQTYYLMAENSGTDNNCLSGTEITSNKKVAVFQGVPCTFIPHDIGNRDCLYEQAMPIVYWGTEFVATRSFAKGANYIRITASEANVKTSITINGRKVARQLERGETYEIELQSNNANRMSNTDDHKHNQIDETIIGEYIHIKTSCPCAVYSYDCGASYNDNDKPEQCPSTDHKGDPASVWIAPIEQSIDQITFGACGTASDGGNQTKYHYMDIVVETSTISETVLYSYSDGGIVDIQNEFKPVTGTIYSYARIYLGEADDTKNAAYTVANPKGLVAHVYGNGKSESYAYSVGSSAVEHGIKLDGKKYNTGSLITDKKFCINEPILLDAHVGNDVIERVTWNFGDGITEESEDTQIEHLYTDPNWYEVEVNLWGHKVCDEGSGTVPLGNARVTIRVVEADTIPVGSDHDCIEADSTYNGTKLTAEEIQKMLTYGANDTAWAKRVNCYDPVEITFMTYGIKTTYSYSVEEKDSALVNGTWYYPETVPTDGKVTWTLADGNRYGCDSIITCNLKVLSCLDVELVNTSAETQYICQGRQLEVPYTVKKGEIISATFTIDNQAPEELSLNHTTRGDGTAVLPTETLVPGVHHAVISMEDTVCEKVLDKHYDFVVRYPDDIFAFKYNNVLAVYQKGYGGNTGFDFTGYQWYRNGQKIEGATSAVYYTEAPFTPGDTYSVELTNAQNVTVPSCGEFVVPDENELDDYTPKKAPSATKKLINRHMYIIVEDQMYDAYGQRVK